jgi:ATP-binding cassette subfamily B protein
MKLLSHLKKYWFFVLIIIGLLIGQAFCDLALPTYTSNIVDTGIIRGGIESVTPKQLSEKTMLSAQLFMMDPDIARVNNAYTLDNGVYSLNDPSTETMESLQDVFRIPLAVLAQSSTNPEFNIENIQMAITSGVLTKEQLLQGIQEQMAAYSTLSDTAMDQVAIALIKAEYETLGVDLEAMQTQYIVKTGVRMIVVVLIGIVIAIIVGFLGSVIGSRIGRDLRQRVYEKILSFSNREMDQFTGASLITRSTNDIQQIQMVLIMFIRMIIYAPILGIGGVIKVTNTHTGLGWIIGVAVICILILVGSLMVIAMPKFKKLQKLIDVLNKVSREILTGISVIRAFGREKHEEKRFDEANTNLYKTQLFTNRMMSIMFPIMMLIMNAITLGIVWFGGKQMDLGNLMVGSMMAFITYTMQIVMSFMMLSMISIMLPRANVAAERVDEVLRTNPSIVDPTNPAKIVSGKGVLAFHDVSFRYLGANEDVLKHISFSTSPGSTTAIIGSTGSGKSTLVNLITRLYDVTQGSITLDGMDIREIEQFTLRDAMGVVPQKGILFSGDIESNIRFGNDSLSEEDVIRAASISQAAQFIDEKDDKYQSPIAQGGNNVSGGQKQRLSIARAIAKNPQILIFDDSFSALDYRTDITLRKALKEQIGDTNVIIVAQRISTILHADQIIVLDQGEVVGIGTHVQLLHECQTYLEIAKSQLNQSELGLEEAK